MLLEILAFAGGMSPLLMTLSVTRLYVQLVMCLILLPTVFVLFLMKRWRMTELSGIALVTAGLALVFTVLQTGETVALAYSTGFAGVLMVVVGYVFVNMASRRSGKVC